MNACWTVALGFEVIKCPRFLRLSAQNSYCRLGICLSCRNSLLNEQGSCLKLIRSVDLLDKMMLEKDIIVGIDKMYCLRD